MNTQNSTQNSTLKRPQQYIKEAVAAQKNKALTKSGEFYSVRRILGNDWAIFYFLIGGREAGKSYSTTNFFVRQWRRYHRPFYWLRLTDGSARKLLQNNAEKLIDPDIRRRWNLDIVVNGTNVYEVTKRDAKGKIVTKDLMARVLALNTFYNDKGNGLYDKDFLKDPNMYYNICLDEMNREQDEKNTFDIVYAFANQIENLIRSTKNRVRIICIGNTLQEASDILSVFDFLPQKFGTYKLHSKRAVIEYIAPSEAYVERRTGTAADILAGQASTFSNVIELDTTQITKQRLIRPSYVIKFSKDRAAWFTVWDGQVVARWNGEKCQTIVAMRPYIDEVFLQEARDNVYRLFNARAYWYRNMITQSLFKKELSILRKNG